MKKILLAVDGSRHSFNAAKEAAELAEARGSEVTALHVSSQESMSSYIVQDWEFIMVSEQKERMQKNIEALDNEVQIVADKIFERVQEIFTEKGLTLEKIFRKGNPAEEICKTAEEGNYDLIVIGSRGLGEIKGLMLGSVSNRVAQSTKIPVLIVK